MKEKTEVLYLEDNLFDEELVRNIILSECSNCNIISVTTKEDFTLKLKKTKVDIILADYNLQGFNGFTALKIALKINSNIPFIFITGQMSEDMAKKAIKAGARDYVFKNQLNRLIPVFKKVLEEVNKNKKIIKEF